MSPRTLGPILALVLTAALGAPATAQEVYLAFGDSITDGVGDEANAGGYPERLESLLNNAGRSVTVLNRGVGSERTDEGRGRLPGVLNNTQPDVLLLMEGSNDVSRDYPLEDSIANLTAMANEAVSRQIAVIHATTIPRLPAPRAVIDPGPEDVANQRLNRNIRNLAGEARRRLADNYEVFGAEPDPYGRLYSPTPTDRVGHPNAAGYDLMARVFFDVIQGNDTVPPVLGIVRPANGVKQVDRNQALRVDIWDFGAGIDSSSVVLRVDGQPVTPSVAGGRTDFLSLTYQPPGGWTGTTEATFSARDLATPANTNDELATRFIPAGTSFLGGDIDQDGRVDGFDLVDFARRFGATRGQTLYNQRADIDNNDVIDGVDLARLAENFGLSSF